MSLCESKAIQDEIKLFEKEIMDGLLSPREASLRILQKILSKDRV
jgi:hypothetical protein